MKMRYVLVSLAAASSLVVAFNAVSWYAAPSAAPSTSVPLAGCLRLAESGAQECIRRVMAAEFDAYGAAPAIRSAVATTVTEAPVGIDCHSVLHLVGELAGARYGEESMLDGLEDCSAGFYHGVLMGVGSPDAAASACSRLSGEHVMWECWHGVGHVLWVHHLEAASALDGCDAAPSRGMRRACSNGALMEAALRLGSDVFSVCDDRFVRDFGLCLDATVGSVAIASPSEAVLYCTGLQVEELRSLCLQKAGNGVGTSLVLAGLSSDASVAASELREGQEDCLLGVAFGLAATSRSEDVLALYCSRTYGAASEACLAAASEHIPGSG